MRFSKPALGVLCATVGLLSYGATTALGETLPDGRVYEMVSSPENHEADVYVPSAMEGRLNAGTGGTETELPFQVALGGEAIAYVGASTVGGDGEVGGGLGNGCIARRGSPGGWSQTVLQPSGHINAFYQAFSSDLSVGFLNAGYEETSKLSPEAPGDVRRPAGRQS